MTDNIFDIKDEDFQEKVTEKSKEKLVVADFWADWCMPCKMLAPNLEEVISEYSEKVDLAKVNVDEASESAERFSIMSIPSVKLFKNGEVIDEFNGAMPKESIKEWLEKNLE